MPDPIKAIEAMHAAYQRATGFVLALDLNRQREWFEVFRRGISAEDIVTLIQFLHGEIRAQRRNPGCLKFRNLVGNPDYLEEDIQDLRASLASA